MYKNQLVTTPYGIGQIVNVRQDSIIVVRPYSWIMANNQRATYYLNPKDVNPFFNVGDTIDCIFGQGTIKAFRESDQIYIVELLNWKLATDKSPILYLQQTALSKPNLKETTNTPTLEQTSQKLSAEIELERANTAFVEFLEKGIKAKNEATELFNGKVPDFQVVKQKYLEALGCLQLMSEDLTNDQKAQVFELTVPCQNNVALCCFKLKSYHECILFAKNALLLINSLEETLPYGLVWLSMLKNGMNIEKLLKVWKRKSLVFIGKSEMARQNFDEAIEKLEEAKNILGNDEKYKVDVKQIVDVLVLAKKNKATEAKRAKDTWSKAFEKNKTIETAPDETPLIPQIFPLKKVIKTIKNEDTIKQKESKKKKDSVQLWSPQTGLFLTFVTIGLGSALFWWMRGRKFR
eukprot:gene6736-9230_t